MESLITSRFWGHVQARNPYVRLADDRQATRSEQCFAVGVAEKRAYSSHLLPVRLKLKRLSERRDFVIYNFWQDVRLGLRMLRKNPGFTSVAIFTLAFGIGASTAIFSVVNPGLLRPFPFPRPSELANISARITPYDIPYLPLSYPDFVDLRSTSSSFSALAIYGLFWKEFSSDDKPQRIENIQVSEDFFAVLGMQPLYGRTFVASDMRPGSRS